MAEARTPTSSLKKARWQRPRSVVLERVSTPQPSEVARSKSSAPVALKDRGDGSDGPDADSTITDQDSAGDLLARSKFLAPAALKDRDNGLGGQNANSTNTKQDFAGELLARAKSLASVFLEDCDTIPDGPGANSTRTKQDFAGELLARAKSLASIFLDDHDIVPDGLDANSTSTDQHSEGEPRARTNSLAPVSVEDRDEGPNRSDTTSTNNDARCASLEVRFKDTPHSSLSTQCDVPVGFGDNFDDLASSFADSDGFASLSLSTSHSSHVPFADSRPRSTEIVEEEQRGESLRLDVERHRQELEQLQLLIQQSERQHAESMDRLNSRKAKFALQQGDGPMNWGISVQQLGEFADRIKLELREYCVHHRYETGSRIHVCCSGSCSHRHGCAKFRGLASDEDPTLLSNVEPNMHTVVQLFIRPLTMDHHGARGLALKLNAESPKRVEKFISHSWSGRFEDFVATLNRNLLPETVVFICSFALPQNLDVGPILGGDLERTPFAQAHSIAKEVMLVIDSSIDVIERAWVIYELNLSLKRDKPIQIALTKSGCEFRNKIMEKVGSLDVRATKATQATDLQAIMGAIAGMEDTINSEICTKLAEKVHQFHQLEACLHHETSREELQA